MTRRILLGLLVLAPCGPATGETTTSDPPNILFILVDDLGPEWIGCYGASGIQTPHIDALAASGLRFTSAWSMPKCTPSRVTLLTGQYPYRHGWVNHWDVPRWGGGCHFDASKYPSLGRILRAAGYRTAAAGKWQVSDFRIQPDAMEDHGFEDYCMWTGFEEGNPPSAERYWNPYLHTREGSRTHENRFGPDVFTDFLVEFMRRHREEPVFLYFPMVLTHGPLVATPLEPGVTSKMDRHRAMVRYVDHLVGRLVEAIEELGLRERTLIFFTTDNGTSRGIEGRIEGRPVKGGKGTLGENGVLEPFIVSCPGRVPAGAVSDALTDFTDVLPTLAGIAGASLPPGHRVDGRSLAGLLLGRETHPPRQWILSMGGGVARLTPAGVVPARPYADRVVRGHRYKLWIEDGSSSRLYDLREDPGETANLLESEDPAVVAARRRLEAVVAGFPPRDAAPRYDPARPRSEDAPSKPDSPSTAAKR